MTELRKGTFTMEGYLGPAQIRKLTALAGQWGLLATIDLEASDNETDTVSGQLFQTLRSRSDFFGREHIESFAELHPEYDNPTLIGRTFNSLIAYKERQYFRGIVPRPGLTVKKRDEVGLDPYPSTLQQPTNKTLILTGYAVEVGSFIDTMTQTANFNHATDIFLITVCEALAHQVEVK